MQGSPDLIPQYEAGLSPRSQVFWGIPDFPNPQVVALRLALAQLHGAGAPQPLLHTGILQAPGPGLCLGLLWRWELQSELPWRLIHRKSLI